jgi:hypothetical protein
MLAVYQATADRMILPMIALWLGACTSGTSGTADSNSSGSITDSLGTDGTAGDSGNETESGDSGADSGVTVEASAAVVPAGDRPVNLLVISIDTLRRDKVGFHSGLSQWAQHHTHARSPHE